jgi:hypothetical protein
MKRLAFNQDLNLKKSHFEDLQDLLVFLSESGIKYPWASESFLNELREERTQYLKSDKRNSWDDLKNELVAKNEKVEWRLISI